MRIHKPSVLSVTDPLPPTRSTYSTQPTEPKHTSPIFIDGNRKTYIGLEDIEKLNKIRIKENEQPIPEKFAGEFKLTSDQIPFSSTKIEYNPIFKDNNVEIVRERTVRHNKNNQPRLTKDTLSIRTGNTADIVNVSQEKNGNINANINGTNYRIRISDKETPIQSLTIRTGGGNDIIKIDENVDIEVIIEGGDGDDDITSGSARTRVFGGAGDDTIRLGRGIGYAEGNDGNDIIYAGQGKSVIYGNNGDDRLYGYVGLDANPTYMDGGRGNDHLIASSAHTIMNGGLGNDTLQGRGRTTFYSGKGKDRILSANCDDLIYAKNTDSIHKKPGARLTHIRYQDIGKSGINVEGSSDFKQRVEDDLEMIRSSPNGQKMLTELDSAAKRNGKPLRLLEVQSEDNSFNFGWTSDENQMINDGKRPELGHAGMIKDGVRGKVMTHVQVQYNRSYIDDGIHKNHPASYLYHEMSHAYNGMNGTMMPGTTKKEPNVERQAVGLPTDAEPFDFDNDPTTPATNTNPDPFNENALRKEMGEPLRKRYKG